MAFSAFTAYKPLDLSGLDKTIDNLGQTWRDGTETEALLKQYDASRGGLTALGQSSQGGGAPGALAALGQSARSPKSAVANYDPGKLGDVFAAKEAEYGLPQGYLRQTAAIESGGNPNAKNPNSSAGGLFQFIDSTANQYGLANKFDPIASTEAAARLAADNKKALASALGREPTAGELYLAHQQGAGGAIKLLSNPNAPAEAVVGADAARLNGGSGLTAGQFAQKWTGKVDGAGQPVQMAQAPAQPGAPMADAPAPGAAEAQGFAVPGGQPASRQNVGPDMIRTLLANRSTRDIGKQLWAQTLSGKSYGFQMIGDQLYRTNAQTGAAELVPGVTNPGAALDQKSKALDIAKKERELQGEGAIPLSPEERQQFGITGTVPAYKTRDGSIKFGPAGTTVNNNLPSGEKAQDQVIGKAYGEQFVEMQKGARDASKTLGTIGMMERLIQTPGFYSGMGGERSLAVNRALVSLGIKDPKAATAQEAFQALSNQVVLDAAGGSLGASISNGDREYINATAPSLANTPEGNKELLGIRRKMAERQQLIGKMARDYAKANGGRLDAGFDEQVSAFAEANPLFKSPAAPVSAAGPAVQPTPAQGQPGPPTPSAPAAVPPSAAEYLRSNPALRNDFDAKYGPGSAARILGN